MRASGWMVLAVFAGSCAPPKLPSVLELTLSPKAVTDATPVQIRVVGTKGDGSVGAGTVKITSTAGSLVTPVRVSLDRFGTASAELFCDPTSEPECAQPVRVVGEWVSDGAVATAEARLNATGTVGTGTGSGIGTTGGGAGGGSGGGSSEPFMGVYITGSLESSNFSGIAPVLTPRAIFGLIPTHDFRALSMTSSGSVYFTYFLKVYRLGLDSLTSTNPLANDSEITTSCGASWGANTIMTWPDTGEVFPFCYNNSLGEKLVPEGWVVSALGWNRNVLAHNDYYHLAVFRDGAKVAEVPLWADFSRSSANSEGFLVTDSGNCRMVRVSYAGLATPIGMLPGVTSPELGMVSCCGELGTVARDGSLYVEATIEGAPALVRCVPGGGASLVFSHLEQTPQPHLVDWDVIVP